ncbi:MAG: glycoside hydrolase family 31 protein, partial [Rhodospirillales bacterium]|nr:glycoside hydrolase family 31 protein [Rhodospirillales bacterium]
MKPLRTARLQAATPRGLELACEHGVTCRISLLGADLARVRFTRADGPRERRSWMVPAHGAPDVPWQGRPRDDESAWPLVAHTCEEVAGAVILRGPSLALRVDLAPFALSWMLPDGTIFARDRAAHAVMLGRTALRHASARHPADRYHGLGDKTGPLDLHGRRLRTTMIDSLGYDPERGDPLYKHWPFLIVRDGASGIHHGILYDSLAEATFDLGCEHDNYYGLYRSYDAADGDLDYYVFPGPGLLDVTAKFLDLTGHAPSPPRWSLGYAQTAMSLADAPDAQARIENFLGECAAQDMPISAFHFGSGYTSIGPRRYVFTWNRAKFPDPEALMRRFHAQGVRLVANLKPCLLDDHPAFAEVAASGAFVTAQGAPALSQFWDGEGAHLDFTNPAAIAWWQDGLRASVLGTGIDAAWNDNNEYGFREEEALCHGFGEALPLDRARSLHALLMTRASLEAQRAARPDERAFTVTRAGCPGIQRYAQSWSGDNTTSWASLKWNLRTGLQMSLSGLFNIGHDVGGFAGPEPEAELLVRWTQAGLLHPRFIMNSWKTSGVTTVPWLHAEVAPMVRAAICLRYRLIPYLYSLMQDRHAPPLRPVFAQFPGDPACLADSDDLMLGPFLLAAPVVE